MRWTILQMPGPEPLFTTDNPILKRNIRPPAANDSFYDQASRLGAMNPDIEIWLPVSKSVLLALSHDVEAAEEYRKLIEEKRFEEAEILRSAPKTLYGSVPQGLGRAVRTMIAGNAHRYVFSPVRDEFIAKCMKAPSSAPIWKIN
jgi:hypothetical protein